MSVREITISDLRRRIVPRRLPRSEEYRTYYGRSLDMARIEYAIRQAECGQMVAITDLESETLSLDGHVQALAVKRFGAIQSTPWGLTPAKGPDIDAGLAEELADLVRAQLTQIPCFGERLYDLAWAEYDGRGAHEIQWEQRPGRDPWWVRQLDWIHPRRLSFDRARDLRLIDTWQQTGNFADDGLRLADVPGKFIWWLPRLFREYPEREGLAPRSLYWTFFKRFSWRYRMILIELFAVPWRIVKGGEYASPEGLEAAEEAAEALGRDTTARFERDIDLDVVFPHENSGQLFQMTSDDVDKQMSKLWLGNTGTTDTNDTNRAGGIVAKGEQDIIHHRLGEGLSGRVQEQLVVPIVALNRGHDAVKCAPRFALQTDPPRDREKGMGLLERAVALQVPVAIDEVRETSGTRAPDDDEAYVVGMRDEDGKVRYQVVDPSESADLDAASAAASTQEDEGTAGAEDRADEDRERMVAQIVTRAGITTEAATMAYDAAMAWRLEDLHRVPGLGTDDARWIAEVGGGIRQLAKFRGLDLTDDAIEALASMGQGTRDAVLEALLTDELTDDHHRPLDP